MAENKRDYYEVLGVNKNATDEELKKAFEEIMKTELTPICKYCNFHDRMHEYNCKKDGIVKCEVIDTLDGFCCR